MPRPPRQWGAVNEIVPADRLLARAREIAEGLAALPPLATSYTRIAHDPEIAPHHRRRRRLRARLGGHLRGRSCSLQKRGLNHRHAAPHRATTCTLIRRSGEWAKRAGPNRTPQSKRT